MKSGALRLVKEVSFTVSSCFIFAETCRRYRLNTVDKLVD